jgi:hypothetical protein
MAAPAAAAALQQSSGGLQGALSAKSEQLTHHNNLTHHRSACSATAEAARALQGHLVQAQLCSRQLHKKQYDMPSSSCAACTGQGSSS